MIRASELTEKLVFQQVASVSTSNKGARTPNYTDFKSVWGSVKTQSAGDRIRGEKLSPEKRVLVRVRFINGLESDMRIKHTLKRNGGIVYYKIDSFDDVNHAGKVHEIIAVEDAST